MRTALARVAPLALTLLALSCASPEKLALQSEEALSQGHTQEAYDKARKALDKEPGNERARQAMGAAAAQLMNGWKDSIRTLAVRDTMGAARRCQELDAFRQDVSDHHVGLPPDTLFERQETLIRSSAAAFYYRQGVAGLNAHQARAAYDAFLEARGLMPGYRDVESLVREAYSQAVENVAILPLANETDVRDLSAEASDQVYSEVLRRVTKQHFRFTVVMSRDQVYAQVPVAALSRMTRDDALRIGRQLGASCVIYGRLFGLNSHTDTDTWHQDVTRRERVRDEKGHETERYVDDSFDVVTRRRGISVQYELVALDTDTGARLGSKADVVRTEAHTIFTSYIPADDPDTYFLHRPDLDRQDPDRARGLEQGWKSHAGAWSLPELMKRAQDSGGRASYRPAFRGEFSGHTKDRPVFLGELPPEGDLALVALGDLWEPVLAMLKELEKAP